MPPSGSLLSQKLGGVVKNSAEFPAGERDKDKSTWRILGCALGVDMAGAKFLGSGLFGWSADPRHKQCGLSIWSQWALRLQSARIAKIGP